MALEDKCYEVRVRATLVFHVYADSATGANKEARDWVMDRLPGCSIGLAAVDTLDARADVTELEV